MTAALAAGRATATARRHQRVLAALAEAIRAGGDPSVAAIARAAGVDRSFLYRHRDLLTELHRAQSTARPTVASDPAVSAASLAADLANAHARTHRQADRIAMLEKRLSEALGEQLWHDTGLGAPTDVEALQATITTQEQQIVDLRQQLHDRDQELAAARAANRELMAVINTPPRTR